VKESSQDACSASVVTAPVARPGPISAPSTRIQEPSGALSSAAGTVTLVARGPFASRSKRTNQIEAVGSAPGRLWTVWRIQIPWPPPGRQAFT
jgi:hypothetical protein